MIKLTTFIKAYKIALSNIFEKVNKWKSVYLGEVHLPGESEYSPEDRILFIFSSSSTMDPGSQGIQASLSVAAIEGVNGGLDNITIAKEYINADKEINEAGRMLIALDNLYQTFKNISEEDCNSVNIKSLWFDFDKGLAVFQTDIFKSPVSTDGKLFLIGGE